MLLGPALGVSVKSVHLVAGRLEFYSQSGHTTDFKIVFTAFTPGARHKRKCEGFCVCVVRHVMSLNSVQSFVIENCNGPTIENGLNNVCLHPLSRTFTFTVLLNRADLVAYVDFEACNRVLVQYSCLSICVNFFLPHNCSSRFYAMKYVHHGRRPSCASNP